MFDQLETEAVVKAKGRVELLDVDGQRLARRARFILQLTQQFSSDPGAPMLRQQRDVYDPDFLFATIHIEAAGGYPCTSMIENCAVG
jgi:hypothetical protein